MKANLRDVVFSDVRNTSCVLDKYIKDENCRVYDNEEASGEACILFVSSNGIYLPNTEEAFASAILQNDRYEWLNLSKIRLLKSNIKRFIFIRDVYKQWYVSGINDRIDDLDKLIDYLSALTRGYRLIVVGNSSGGYLSALLGSKLRAERVFSISGQWDIRDQVHEAPFIRAEVGNTYLNIMSHLDPQVPIYYLYPAACKWDLEQAELVKAQSNVIPIPFDSANHGATAYGFNLPYLFLMDQRRLVKLSKASPKSGWSKQKFLFASLGYIKGSVLFLEYILHRVLK